MSCNFEERSCLMRALKLPSHRTRSCCKGFLPAACLLLILVCLPAGCSRESDEGRNSVRKSQPVLPGRIEEEEESTPGPNEDTEGRNDWFLFERTYPFD